MRSFLRFTTAHTPAQMTPTSFGVDAEEKELIYLKGSASIRESTCTSVLTCEALESGCAW